MMARGMKWIIQIVSLKLLKLFCMKYAENIHSMHEYTRISHLFIYVKYIIAGHAFPFTP